MKNIWQKIKTFFVPAEVDFFGMLTSQSKLTGKIIHALNDFATHDSSAQEIAHILKIIHEAKLQNRQHLIELNRAFITPVDKEAFSRVYNSLHWIDLSVKHLLIEMDTYGIYQVAGYTDILKSLSEQINSVTAGLGLLNHKRFDDILQEVEYIIHLDNELIKKYAALLKELYRQQDLPYLLAHKEILSQLKEISKRMHVCANLIEDIVFKMN